MIKQLILLAILGFTALGAVEVRNPLSVAEKEQVAVIKTLEQQIHKDRLALLVMLEKDHPQLAARMEKRMEAVKERREHRKEKLEEHKKHVHHHRDVRKQETTE